MRVDLTGRRALVSGSTQGIGRAIGTALARAGASTVVNGRSADRVQGVVAELRAELPGADVRGVDADLATAEGANNLGIFGPRPVLEVDDDEWRCWRSRAGARRRSPAPGSR